MLLITMAHLGEAQSVIDLFQLKRLNPSVFEGENLTCLITGEGPFEAATQTSLELGKRPYRKVVNLGIAGSLSPAIEMGSIHPVRSVYLVIDGKPQFKSFRSFEKGLDCVTSFERMLDPVKTKPLSGMGSLVDREAWGVAMAAKTAGVPFESYKLISDVAGTLGACEVVKTDAQEFSQKLAASLKDILVTDTKPVTDRNLPGFYFTFAMSAQFEDMLKKLTLREEKTEEQILLSLPLDVLRADDKLIPKERTRKLLEHMEGKLDPLKETLRVKLGQWKTPFERQGIQISTDPTWENPEVKLQFTLKNDEELAEKLKILSKLSLAPFHSLRNGDVHVE